MRGRAERSRVAREPTRVRQPFGREVRLELRRSREHAPVPHECARLPDDPRGVRRRGQRLDDAHPDHGKPRGKDNRDAEGQRPVEPLTACASQRPRNHGSLTPGPRNATAAVSLADRAGGLRRLRLAEERTRQDAADPPAVRQPFGVHVAPELAVGRERRGSATRRRAAPRSAASARCSRSACSRPSPRRGQGGQEDERHHERHERGPGPRGARGTGRRPCPQFRTIATNCKS